MGHHHHPQLLIMKECFENKVPIVKMSWDYPLYPSSKNDQVDSDNNNLGESNMIKDKEMKKEYLYPMYTYNLVSTLTSLDFVVP